MHARSRIARIAGLAAAYLITGKLGLLLAIPPGYATALWPPSGIALATLLLLGNECWPGVLIGSFLVNLSASYDGASQAQSIGVAAALGVGASVQALLGASLIRRFVGASPELLRGREVAAFLLLGGPVSCAASATIGVSTLAIARIVQPAQIPFSWWTWWIGDVVGVLVVAPLVMIALAQPREVWRRRVATVAVPLLLMLAFFTTLFVVVSGWERAAIEARFRSRSEGLASALREHLEAPLGVLRALETSYAADPALTRASFRALAAPSLSRFPSIQALSWNPRVLDADRANFERGGAEGPCPILDRDAKDVRIPAPRRGEYVPIRYIEPHDANAAAIGYDVSTSIIRFEALKRACDSGQPAVTRKLRLVQESDPSGLLIFLPVYPGVAVPSSEEERRRLLAGYFAVVLRQKDFFKPLEEQAKAEGIDLSLEVPDAASASEPFWQSAAATGKAPPREFQHGTPFMFAERNWSAVCRATPAYVSGERSWRPWGMLAGGMLLTGLLGAFLLAATGGRPSA
ncbi:MAG TPA: CHASE domain-containing protein [Planctomycetota bacterium]|nr:CHASE domain-containing protein [Planctomycetota bacterium]